MTQYYSRIDTTLNGDVYNIPFSYMKESEISVYINDEPITAWEFLNESQIKINEMPSEIPADAIVSIRRTTDITKKVVDYTNQSMLKKENLNLSQNQLLNAVQEIYDNNVQFEIDTENNILQNRTEIDAQIEANKQELLDIQSSFESEVTQTIADNKQEVLDIQADFEQEVNTTIETVTEAAEKVNKLEQAVEEAKTAAQTATDKADETQEVLTEAVTEMDSKLATAESSMDSRLSSATATMNEKLSAANTAVENATEQANLATQKAQEILDINPAKTDLSNLTEAGEKHFLNKSQITNCITEIPQRIKLELNDGTLTLKAGSKVYALDGSSYTIPTDVTFSYSHNTAHSSWILVKENGEMSDIWTTESASDISIGSKWVTFHGINYYLPICLATHNADGTTKSGWKSIDQVFNGMGYIGSTIWVDKGVKVLIPNGRNDDGSLKNIKFETEKVLITTYSNNISFTSGYIAFQGSPNNISWDSRDWWKYNDKDNKFIGKDGSITEFCYLAKCDMTNGVISNFQPKQPFRAVDWNDALLKTDKAEITSWGMPSSKYTDLSVGNSGSTYTAPANGWFCFDSWVTGAFIYLQGYIIRQIAPKGSNTGIDMSGYIPVRKGETVVLGYDGTWQPHSWQGHPFKFVYAEGSK